MDENTLEVVIDADRINVDGFFDLLELQKQIENPPTVQNLRDMYRLMAPAVVSPELSRVPGRYMNHIFETVMAGLTRGVDPN